MYTNIRYGGSLEAISSDIISDPALADYPFKASLILQLERLCAARPAANWIASVCVNYNASHNGDKVNLLVDIAVTLAS